MRPPGRRGNEVIFGGGKILTAGGVDTHVHFICPEQIHEALASGLTTLIGGGTGPADGSTATTVTPGSWHVEGRVRDVASLQEFCRGRLHTSGLVAAGLATATAAGCDPLLLEEAADARTPSPPCARAHAGSGGSFSAPPARCTCSPPGLFT